MLSINKLKKTISQISHTRIILDEAVAWMTQEVKSKTRHNLTFHISINQLRENINREFCINISHKDFLYVINNLKIILSNCKIDMIADHRRFIASKAINIHSLLMENK